MSAIAASTQVMKAATGKSRAWVPYALIAPSVVFLALLFVIPLVQTFWLSFTGTAADGATALSLDNYRRMVGDLNFLR